MLDRNSALVGATTCFIAITSLPATASAADGPFISGLIGGIYTEDVEADDIDVDYDTGFAIAGQFGYKFNQFRLAGELGYQIAEGLSDNNVNAEIGVTRFTVNGYVDLPMAPRVGPYLGGGFGVAAVRTGDDLSNDFEDEDTAFTWHGEVGLNIGLTDQFFIAPAYRYQWTDTDIGGQTEPLASHIFGVALRYQFYSSRRDSAYSAPAGGSVGGGYSSGYTGYGPSYYDRYDRYGRYRGHHRHDHDDKPEKTPEQREKDKCGWQGPGCDD